MGKDVPEAQDLETTPAVGETWYVQDSNFPEFQRFRTVLVKAIHKEDGTAKVGNAEHSDDDDEDGMPRQAMWHKVSS